MVYRIDRASIPVWTFSQRTKVLAKSSYWSDSRDMITCQRPRLRAETSTKIWMNGLNQKYNTTCPNSGLNLRNCCKNVRAWDSLLSFATPSWFCRSHQREHPLRGSSLNFSRFYLIHWWFSCHYIQCSFLFSYNILYKMLWVCSLQPLEIHFVSAWDCCQQPNGNKKHSHHHTPQWPIEQKEKKPPNKENKNLTITNINTNGLKEKNRSTQTLLETEKVNVALITESNKETANIKRYKWIGINRKDKSRGSVGILIANKIANLATRITPWTKKTRKTNG